MKYIYKFILILLVLFLSTLFYIQSSANRTSYKFYVVSSDSMSPVLNKGSLVVEKPVDSLSIGDIVTFKSPLDQKQFITHRIYRENFDGEIVFSTKGDNNSAEDPWTITPEMIVGKLSFVIPFIGYPILFLKSSLIYSYILIALLLIISLIEINLLSSEIIYIWNRKNSYRIYRRLKKYINMIDNFLSKFHGNKIGGIENAGI